MNQEACLQTLADCGTVIITLDVHRMIYTSLLSHLVCISLGDHDAFEHIHSLATNDVQ